MPDWDSTERRESDEDAAWRDLVARFEAPEAADQPSPWPELEDTAAADAVDPPPANPALIVASRPPPDPDGEHFVPPPPPPLPKLEPLTKAAWLGLFGGPAYLLVATAAGWSIPGIAVFCAIAAFVGGVALLVIRLNDSGPPSAGDDNDGAVV
ncbi:MAG TPA: hypothetical protein VF070_11630 [Streptosporangiaceae bacterium]